MYKTLIRPLLFLIDPEKVHHLSFWMLRIFLTIPGLAQLVGKGFTHSDPSLPRTVFGLTFRNPVGLAAGFDKDALLLDKWRHLGFGFVEIGTVTPRAQVGNPKKRLFRLPKDKALINRMGFNNAGVDAMVDRLKEVEKSDLIIGANIGKNKDTSNNNAVDDYLICFEALFEYVDYFVVNVSSPNTPGLRELQEKEPLTRLLNRLQEANKSNATPKPLLLKIAPDLTDTQLEEVIEVVNETGLDGLILTNTTIDRSGLTTPAADIEKIGAGGLSGAPLTHRAGDMLGQALTLAQGRFPIISVGGIMQPADAATRLTAGAALVQVYSGFVYEGPAFAKRICRFLLEKSVRPNRKKV